MSYSILSFSIILFYSITIQTVSLFIMKSFNIALISLILLGGILMAGATLKNKNSTNLKTDETVVEAPSTGTCVSYLPYGIWDTIQTDYFNWFGLYGKSVSGNTFQIGHALSLHVASNGACTLEQKQANKTVFLNMNELQKALSKIPAPCDIPNHTTFTYDYEGKFASPTDYIVGIDCGTGEKKSFPGYFIEFKRAIKNPKPTKQDYMNSNYVTIWTFYPKRG